MKRLMQLKRDNGWSILVIAHTPKRSLGTPITQNDLAGSKLLFNFFDSVFAIGKSANGRSRRYVKQLKARNCEMTYGADNVLCCHIEKEGPRLYFSVDGTGPESAHLVDEQERRRQKESADAKHLRTQGLTQQQIATRLGFSIGKVNALLRL